MLSPSDIVVRSASLAERLTTDAQADMPVHQEPTPTTMAERFAPEGQRAHAEPPMGGFVPQQARASSANRWLLIASLFISLVPTAAILALIWQGTIRLPGTEDRPIIVDYEQIAASQRASLAAVPLISPPSPPSAVEIEVKPEIALTAPSRVAARPGEEVDFVIAIDSADALPARSVIAVRALPEGAEFSQGRPYDSTEWNLRPDEIGDLKIKLPQSTGGGSELRIELMAADGTVLAAAKTRLEVAADPRAALIVRADEEGRVADLIAHGQKMIDVGYLAGARAYFKRAAEAGSGEAALKLGATYDPEFIDQIGALGVKADPKEARAWYERAKQLGVQGAEEKLRALKEDWSPRDEPVQATEAETDAAVLAVAEEGDGDIVAAPEAEAQATTSAPLPDTAGEWVSLLNYANVRSAPSTTADTLRVAEKGAKLRVTGRKGNWVQVTDPDTAETGWVYSRFIETTE